jgi:hypothetical protein
MDKLYAYFHGFKLPKSRLGIGSFGIVPVAVPVFVLFNDATELSPARCASHVDRQSLSIPCQNGQ